MFHYLFAAKAKNGRVAKVRVGVNFYAELMFQVYIKCVYNVKKLPTRLFGMLEVQPS